MILEILLFEFSGNHFCIVSPNDNSPLFSKIRTAIAVNCFDTDAILNFVSNEKIEFFSKHGFPIEWLEIIFFHHEGQTELLVENYRDKILLKYHLFQCLA